MKVLVVDDTRHVRARLAELLGAIPGVEAVVEAGTAAEALDALRAESPDVVVLDLHLRGSSGLTFAPHVKRERPGTLLIVITNDSTEQHRRRCLAAGADAFFDKSRDFEVVVQVVADAIVGVPPSYAGGREV